MPRLLEPLVIRVLRTLQRIPLAIAGDFVARQIDAKRGAIRFPLRPAREGDFDRLAIAAADDSAAVSYTHLRAHVTVLDLVCPLLLEKNHIFAICY